MSRIMESFGLKKMPWVIRVYILLLVFMGALLLVGAGFPAGEVNPELFSLADDGLKLVLGAVLGSLSMATQKEWGGEAPPEKKTKGGDGNDG